MKKVVKKTGGSLGIILNMEDREIMGIEEGDIVEISDIVVIKKAKRRRVKTHD